MATTMPADVFRAQRNKLRDSLIRELARSGRGQFTTQFTAVDSGRDRGDQANISFIRSLIVESQNGRHRHLSEIADALERIEDGSYGTCEGCDSPIPTKRLRVVPTTTHCIECQKAAERAEAIAGRARRTPPVKRDRRRHGRPQSLSLRR